MDGHIDINEITGPMRDAVDRLTLEIGEIETQAVAIEQTCQAEATKVLRKGAEEAEPFRRLAADKRAALNRWQLLIDREEQEAGGQQHGGRATLVDGSLDAAQVNGALGQDGGRP